MKYACVRVWMQIYRKLNILICMQTAKYDTPGSFLDILIMCIRLAKILFTHSKQNLHTSKFTYVCKIVRSIISLSHLRTINIILNIHFVSFFSK